MGCVAVNPGCTVSRLKGNLEPLGARLLDNNLQPLDVTSRSFVFVLVDTITGLTFLSDGSVSIDDPLLGLVSWQPRAGETDTPGTYAGYFLDQGRVRDHPYDGRSLLLVVKDL